MSYCHFDGHCVTCSDEALPFQIVHVDEQAGIASVDVGEGREEEIDITLVEQVKTGDIVLVHGGVAIALVEPQMAQEK